jgi:hypothetical protein
LNRPVVRPVDGNLPAAPAHRSVVTHTVVLAVVGSSPHLSAVILITAITFLRTAKKLKHKHLSQFYQDEGKER